MCAVPGSKPPFWPSSFSHKEGGADQRLLCRTSRAGLEQPWPIFLCSLGSWQYQGLPPLGLCSPRHECGSRPSVNNPCPTSNWSGSPGWACTQCQCSGHFVCFPRLSLEALRHGSFPWAPFLSTQLGKRPSAWPERRDWLYTWLPMCGSGREVGPHSGLLPATVWLLNSVRPQAFGSVQWDCLSRSAGEELREELCFVGLFCFVLF